jgi:NDP-sugar pyrophosphorylase family protein
MKSMIFAAGLGTRLKPITDTLPKALVPVCGRPLIEHTCRKLMSAGINEAVVNIHHFADKIEDWANGQDWIAVAGSAQAGNLSQEDKSDMFGVTFSDERAQLLETGGAVLHARPFLEGCGHFLIHNVDILSNADLQWLQSEVRSEALATLLVSERETTRYLLFAPDTMRLVGWHNTDSGAYHLADESIALEDCRALGFSGIHILSDRVLGLMEEYARSRDLPVEDPAGVKFSIMNFYLWAASAYPIYGVVAKDLEFLDVGKLDALAPAEEFVRR